MRTETQQERRQDPVMAGNVQCALALLHVAGAAAARRYLLCRAVPEHVIMRVLGAPSCQHRNCCQQYLQALPLFDLLKKLHLSANLELTKKTPLV
ncbi:MAG: hypothetical protein ACEQSK_02540 [Sphingomonadaceae bacterium]